MSKIIRTKTKAAGGITAEEKVRLDEHAALWTKRILRTEPISVSDITKAIQDLYRVSGLKEPRIVIVPSPLVMALAGGFSAAIWHLRKNTATNTATYAATDAATRAATDAATRDATRAATAAATDDATRAATAAATRDATDDATRDATAAATGPEDAWYRGVDARAMWRVAALFGPANLLIRCAAHTWRMWVGGNQWAAWGCYISSFRHIANIPLDYSKWEHYENAMIHGGQRIMHAEFCMISDRPSKLTVDTENRPHNADGPFCMWRDGTALYAWHGVRVPSRVILDDPASWTLDRILNEKNAEVRRVMLERFGGERLKAVATLRQQDDTGRLYEFSVPGDDTPYVFVDVENSTPEPDGSFKRYTLAVPPTTQTCTEGVAWTFGLTPQEYVLSAQS